MVLDRKPTQLDPIGVIGMILDAQSLERILPFGGNCVGPTDRLAGDLEVSGDS